jgi:UDP:flavonoid glycosyltransferase YjiC (YdhE family)
MSHLGFLSFPGMGHLNPLAALGRRLQRRGHLVTVFQVADLEPTIKAAGSWNYYGCRLSPFHTAAARRLSFYRRVRG